MRMRTLVVGAGVVALAATLVAVQQQGDGSLRQANEAARRVASMQPGASQQELVGQLVVLNPGTTPAEVLDDARLAAAQSGEDVDDVLEQMFLESRESARDSGGR